MHAPPVHPLNDWILVRLDPFAERYGALVLTQDNARNNVRTATVLAIGKGKRRGMAREPVGVHVGEKVAFLRWHLEHGSGKSTTSVLNTLGEDLGLVKGEDILFAFPPGTHVEVTL